MKCIVSVPLGTDGGCPLASLPASSQQLSSQCLPSLDLSKVEYSDSLPVSGLMALFAC